MKGLRSGFRARGSWLGVRSSRLVPWNRERLPKARSAAPGSQGATTENIGHI